jgi:hypothetical protein
VADLLKSVGIETKWGEKVQQAKIDKVTKRISELVKDCKETQQAAQDFKSGVGTNQTGTTPVMPATGANRSKNPSTPTR